ncbi:MAG: flavin reductase [Actinobacteria bacterium]|nr:flavin reductase [Actinomycetota bacterium]
MNDETFVDVMTAFPTGVVVVTTVDGDGAPWGLTSNAVASVSAEPPMLLVCVAKTSRTLPALLERRGFLVNFMGERAAALCGRFASKLESAEKFAASSWRPSALGHPHLDQDSIAFADCETEAEVEAGSHLILVGRVRDCRVTDPHGAPLSYYRRTYRSWGESEPAEQDVPTELSKGEAHVGEAT